MVHLSRNFVPQLSHQPTTFHTRTSGVPRRAQQSTTISTTHRTLISLMLNMTFDQRVGFLWEPHGNDLRMSNMKPKPKARKRELTRWAHQNKVPLAELAMRSLIVGLAVYIDHFGAF
ncbi:e457ac0c-4490-4e59-8e9a-af6418a5d86d-CDS [Sclerotinia trifoliorum]|uniref:E457ac0c-4490-4e59-8e9a-af6418a5d86d-CDS n=1 Tax=Sclerotinia trifoliorum TaxID=28548 RepID=A0A8H2ZU02_9HELO|nr:e457ac0c-4490-4e59-8e9a-af6418a5d86d-CDS [Sclerotinia trifoliorum]